MEPLKEVIYTLEGEKNIGRYEVASEKEREELKEKQKERKGLFLRFGDKVIFIDGHPYTETYGIVQDIDTGEIKSVFPTRIKFV